MHQRKNFIPRNEGFRCEYCDKSVPSAKGTFRNHCPYCLASKHVDDTVPGDRLASCGGLMPPVGILGTNPDKLEILHACVLCGKKNQNILARDDDREEVFRIMKIRKKF